MEEVTELVDGVTPETEAPDATSGESTEPTESDGLKKALQAERETARMLKKELGKLKSQLQGIEDSGKSDLERALAEAERWKSEYTAISVRQREASARESVRETARKIGAPDPDLVYRIVRGDLAFDDDGTVTNLDAVLSELRKEAPTLFKPVVAPVDATKGNAGTAGNVTDMNARIRRATGRGA